jgi:hypothetical protein
MYPFVDSLPLYVEAPLIRGPMKFRIISCTRPRSLWWTTLWAQICPFRGSHCHWGPMKFRIISCIGPLPCGGQQFGRKICPFVDHHCHSIAWPLFTDALYSPDVAVSHALRGPRRYTAEQTLPIRSPSFSTKKASDPYWRTRGVWVRVVSIYERR